VLTHMRPDLKGSSLVSVDIKQKELSLIGQLPSSGAGNRT
jgi:hypothetical protein